MPNRLILRAKAAVCDAYRDWLMRPTQKQRGVLSDALAKLQRLEALEDARKEGRRPRARRMAAGAAGGGRV